MNRAFVALEIKALDDEQRLIEGWATTPDEDRMGDIVLPKGAKYSLPMPFLLDHDHKQVVGEVNHAEVTEKGIKFRAQIKKIDEPGPVQELCDKAWQLVKNGLRRAVSIGFRPLEMEPLKSGGLKFTSWEWYELSAVGVPACAGAVITGTKSYSLQEKFVAEAPPLAATQLEELRHRIAEAAPLSDDYEMIMEPTGEMVEIVKVRPFVRAHKDIPAPPESAATGEKKVRVVKLDAPARDRATPFVINKIHPAKPAGS